MKTRKGRCPRTGKGQRFMGKEGVNGNISGYWVWKRLMSHRAKALQAVNFRFLNFQETPFQA